ncbi:hypothetical protein N7457_003120 [Penicillium paradoxum]|uniref:uncharacterized protein n=1 Tax=Penicillium paradoxum TaxID=176176 RepID=UPI0025483155|nr:uncharacterized protein N7457_003120 [Penicillium paradoxum]KAJ5788130.1 hypothetical protein N7457_003120 [Penicillium paradoxum]
MATLLTTSWVQALTQHLNTQDITFGGVVSWRTVNECSLNRPDNGTYLLVHAIVHRVRVRRYLGGGRHATLGFFQQISDNCTNWSPNASFFSSVVNHHDIEYFDSISFAGFEALVDYANPHPGPVSPARVVSCTGTEQTFVGLVADEERLAFWEERLKELALVMEETVAKSQAATQTLHCFCNMYVCDRS